MITRQFANVYIPQTFKTYRTFSGILSVLSLYTLQKSIFLLFFLGVRNALFVGIAIPLSMFISFIILGMIGYTINIMVLFSLIMALGMLVDNGIVVVENVYRLRERGISSYEATKRGVGEVALPVIASTATTLAAFLPLAFWPGLFGAFMKYLPITLIVTLSSSLFVALVINPVLILVFMQLDKGERPNHKRIFITLLAVVLLGLAQLALWYNNDDLWPIIFAIGAFFTAFNFLEATLPSLVSKTAPADAKGTAMGVYSTSQFAGAFMGGLFGGWAHQALGIEAVFLLGAIVYCQIYNKFFLV